MRNPASTDKEVMMREINETEEALADISRVLGCACIIDPTETLADRVRHLGMIAVVQAANLKELRGGFVTPETKRNPEQLSYWLRSIQEN